MRCALRARDHELALAREKALQANQLIALGSLAAETAHELGTPLAPMAVLAKELEHEYRTSPELTRPLRLLSNQINRCKEILSRMAALAGQAQAEAVALEARWTPVQFQIEITDCGRGLPAALRDHIGEPFVITKPVGPGIGLGLYLARTTLARLGGQLELSEREPSGVVARFVLPLSPLLAARPA